MASINRGPQVRGVASFFLALTWLFVLLRCYCRLSVVKSFGPDDYLAAIAQSFFTFFCVFAILGVEYGTGQHAVDIKPQSNIPIGLKWWWACEPVYVLANMAIKFSIGIYLLRIAVHRGQRFIIHMVMAVSGVIGTYFFFLFVFQCWPVAYFWGQYTGMKGRCINPTITVKSTYAYSAISCWADWSFSILPAFIVWKLNMNKRTKLSVFTILALSAVASTATIVRFPYINGLTDKADFLYATTDVAIWSLSETGLGITAACAATLRPLFRNCLARTHFFGKTTDEVASTGGGGWRLTSNPAHSGYLRRSGRGRDLEEEEIDLRNQDVASMTTTIVGGRGHELDETGPRGKRDVSGARDGSQTHLNDAVSESSGEATWAEDWTRKSEALKQPAGK
ncbi:hypothetical protein FN846DRAFT_941841 [Sphaerosporella brunnea]|uniref:Rhodopsin domain-containing protein n=1 Tax=Sphaerosporella brunnea TaxID=1250544 RepID=A0A5J5F1P7_9PEZI|nr:hypothetical protein FN846DRAFT_941841 [Sphaerosporella brunnea]